MGPSIEAREHEAQVALAMDASETRTFLTESEREDFLHAFPNVAPYPALVKSLREIDPWRAVFLAEAYVTGVRRKALERYRAALQKTPVRLRQEERAVRLDAIESAVACEPGSARRQALLTEAERLLPDLRDPARALVDALRDAFVQIDPALWQPLGVSDPGADEVLGATDDLLRELDTWVCAPLGIDRARMTFADRLRTMVSPSMTSLAPPAAWVDLGARWATRTGLETSLRRVVDDLRPASAAGHGVTALCERAGERSFLAGRSTVAGRGVMDVGGALSVALVCAMGHGIAPGVRRGCDRALDGVAHALGRRLHLERRFLQREAAIDAVPRERYMLEALHAEVLRTRIDAVLARFGAAILARAPEPGQRFHEDMTRALGAAPAPAWAIHVATRCFDDGAWWGGRWGARALGARCEPRVVTLLRERYDEDWFRNPKAGEGVTSVFDAMRAVGVNAWSEAHGGAVKVSEMMLRFDEAMRDARRG